MYGLKVMVNKMKVLLLILALIPSVSFAKTLHLEKWYQEKYCNGVLEFVLPDRTRVDCLTDEYAIEYDFARKWAEGYGQAMYYASQTGRKPGIALIMEKDSEWRFLMRLYETILFSKVPVKVWVVR